ncbi:MAG TPA: hypothetical protein VNC78_00515 [Actinomycetota bacterium]|nr:hypothetical protein [Actinomycetota bacterium]
MTEDSNTSSIAVALRGAGVVMTAGYVLGWADGTIVALAGGLGLVTLGRYLAGPSAGDGIAAAAFTVLAIALGVAALRWATLSLESLRGVQAVLGPTLLVAPAEHAAAASAGAVSGVLALALWSGESPSRAAGEGVAAHAGQVLWSLETVFSATALVTAFWGPALPGRGAPATALLSGMGRWVVLAAAVAACAAVGGRAVRSLDVVWRGFLLALAAVMAILGGGAMFGLVS